MLRSIRAAALFVSLLAAGCAHPPATVPPAPPPPPLRTYGLEEVPGVLAPPVARAEAAMKALRERLGARLAAELAAGGRSRAARVCRVEASALASEIAAQTGVLVGRIGARIRDDAPRWAAPAVEGTAVRRAAEVQPLVLDLGDRIGLLRPIGGLSACVACHGPPDRIAPGAKAALDAGHPGDRATGLVEGDLHGFFWAEAKK
jgi:hypothetical protein